MSVETSTLLAEYAEAQCRFDETRCQLFDQVRDVTAALRPLDDKWNTSGPHSEKDKQWYRESARAIRTQALDLYPLQEAEQAKTVEHIASVRALVKEMSSGEESDQVRLLSMMRDYANERTSKLQEIVAFIGTARSRVLSFTDEVNQKITQIGAPAKKPWWK